VAHRKQGVAQAAPLMHNILMHMVHVSQAEEERRQCDGLACAEALPDSWIHSGPIFPRQFAAESSF